MKPYIIKISIGAPNIPSQSRFVVFFIPQWSAISAPIFRRKKIYVYYVNSIMWFMNRRRWFTFNIVNSLVAYNKNHVLWRIFCTIVAKFIIGWHTKERQHFRLLYAKIRNKFLFGVLQVVLSAPKVITFWLMSWTNRWLRCIFSIKWTKQFIDEFIKCQISDFKSRAFGRLLCTNI